MSDSQKLMRGVLEAHRGRERGMVCDEDELWCDGCKAIVKADEIAAHQAAEIDKALGGLTRETLDKPEFRETGQMIPNPMIVGPGLVPERRLHFTPSERWASDWREVQP